MSSSAELSRSAANFAASRRQAVKRRAVANKFQRKGFLQSTYREPHHFTEDELNKLESFNGIDYWEPVSDLYVDHLANKYSRTYEREVGDKPRSKLAKCKRCCSLQDIVKEKRGLLKGITFVVIGAAVGLWSIILFHTIEYVAHMKQNTVADGVLHHGRGYGFLLWISWNFAMALASTFFCLIYPTAAGSGVPDVMAYLNGVMTTGTFRIQLLILKTTSCICAVNSGLPVGAEGPMIHIGSLIGGGVSSGQSSTLRCEGNCWPQWNAIFQSFRNAKDKRDFVSAGTAAGVASVFGSPLGGLLFVMEEVASFVPSKLAWLTFWCCLVAVMVQQFITSYVEDWHIRDRSSITRPLAVPEASSALFNQHQVPEQSVPLYLTSVVPAAVLGVVLAVVSGIFIKIHLFVVTKWRKPIVNKSRPRKVLEPIVVSFFIGIYWFWIPTVFECMEIPEPFLDENRTDLHELKLFTAGCPENKNLTMDSGLVKSIWSAKDHMALQNLAKGDIPTPFYNPTATLTMTSTDNVIKLLLSRHTGDFLPAQSIFAFFIVYFLGCALSVGMFISSGVVIPTIVIGCSVGRMLTTFMGYEFTEPGLMALVGASAFFGGLSRLTFSVTVIMVDISNDLSHVLLLMLSITLAKMVGDRLCHSLYHEQLAVQGVPFLDFDTQVHKLDAFTAGDIMTNNPQTLSIVSTVRQLWLTVRGPNAHNGFPVVRNADSGDETFLGLISRREICTLLWYMYNFEVNNPGKEPKLPTYGELKTIEDTNEWHQKPQLPDVASMPFLDRLIDITPFIDCSAFFILNTTAISRAYNLFRAMSLRHLCVVSPANQLKGIITRRDLMGYYLRQRCLNAANVNEDALNDDDELLGDDDSEIRITSTHNLGRADSQIYSSSRRLSTSLGPGSSPPPPERATLPPLPSRPS